MPPWQRPVAFGAPGDCPLGWQRPGCVVLVVLLVVVVVVVGTGTGAPAGAPGGCVPTMLLTTSTQRSRAGTRTMHPVATGKPVSAGVRSAVYVALATVSLILKHCRWSACATASDGRRPRNRAVIARPVSIRRI